VAKSAKPRTGRKAPLWARLCAIFGCVLMVASGGLLVTSQVLVARYAGAVETKDLFGDAASGATKEAKSDIKGPVDILLVGIDPRDETTAPLSDSIIVVHVPANMSDAYVFSIPRDLVVDIPPFEIYRALRRVNPSPFLYFLRFEGFEIVGSSPEILVRLRAGEVTVRPIAGTRPRGASAEEDARLGEELLADPKERAEHLMLLDLGRNDVGRVARTASVKVTDQFFIERFSQVMHIVSNVEGQLDGKYDALDALAAGFPAGTVSGAPKVRAMEIIDELEQEKRGLYAGSVGYFSAAGELDSCIVLRTALIKDGVMYVQAGAGIVADSNPKSEQQECVDKAKALFRAAEEAKRFASAARRGQ